VCRVEGTRDEIIGLNATDIVAASEIPRIGEALDVIKSKADYQREWQLRRKDGAVFAVDTIARNCASCWNTVPQCFTRSKWKDKALFLTW